jgi:hypothetical protein
MKLVACGPAGLLLPKVLVDDDKMIKEGGQCVCTQMVLGFLRDRCCLGDLVVLESLLDRVLLRGRCFPGFPGLRMVLLLLRVRYCLVDLEVPSDPLLLLPLMLPLLLLHLMARCCRECPLLLSVPLVPSLLTVLSIQSRLLVLLLLMHLILLSGLWVLYCLEVRLVLCYLVDLEIQLLRLLLMLLLVLLFPLVLSVPEIVS